MMTFFHFVSTLASKRKCGEEHEAVNFFVRPLLPGNLIFFTLYVAPQSTMSRSFRAVELVTLNEYTWSPACAEAGANKGNNKANPVPNNVIINRFIIVSRCCSCQLLSEWL
jgi:hypothetical protein